MQTFYLFTILCHHENVTSRSVRGLCMSPPAVPNFLLQSYNIFKLRGTPEYESVSKKTLKVIVSRNLHLSPDIFIIYVWGFVFIRKLEELLLLQDHVKLQTKYHNCKIHTSKQIELGHPVSFPFLVQHPKGRL